LSATALGTALATEAVTAAPDALAASIAGSAFAAAAATTSGVSFSILKFITMTKVHASIVSAIVLAGLVIPIVLQNRSIKVLQEENVALRRQNAELDRLKAENGRLQRLKLDGEELTRLRAEEGELLRLRGELGSLRRQNQELARGTKATRSASSTPESGATLRDEKVDVLLPLPDASELGYSAPEAALLTAQWAIMNTNAEVYSKSHPDGYSLESAQKEVERKLELFAGLKAIRLTQKRIGTSSATLWFTYEWQDMPPLKNSPASGRMDLTQVGQDWKIGSWVDFSIAPAPP